MTKAVAIWLCICSASIIHAQTSNIPVDKWFNLADVTPISATTRLAVLGRGDGFNIVKLGKDPQLIFSDRSGAKINVVSVGAVGPVGAQWAANDSQGGIWIAEYDPKQKITAFSHFDASGRLSEKGSWQGPISSFVVSGDRLIIKTPDSLTLIHLEQALFKADKKVSVWSDPWVFPVAFSQARVVLIDQATASLDVIDMNSGSQNRIALKSEEIERSVALATANAAQSQGKARGITSVIVGAAAGPNDVLYLLLGQVFNGEGARFLKLNMAGSVMASLMCAQEPGFFPSYIGASQNDLYLVDPLGKGARFQLP